MPYADAAYANTYHSSRLSKDAWAALLPATQAAALQSATDAMDLYAASRGGWRRDYSTDTPEPIKMACCLEALALTDATSNARIKAQQQGVQSTSIGSASESYTGYGALSLSGLVDNHSRMLLNPFLRQSEGSAPIL